MGEVDRSLACFVCRRTLENTDVPGNRYPDRFTWLIQPRRGVVFSSRGNYGSTVYDRPLTSSAQLEIVVCDDCLVDRKALVFEREFATETRTTRLGPWKPEAEGAAR